MSKVNDYQRIAKLIEKYNLKVAEGKSPFIDFDTKERIEVCIYKELELVGSAKFTRGVDNADVAYALLNELMDNLEAIEHRGYKEVRDVTTLLKAIGSDEPKTIRIDAKELTKPTGNLHPSFTRYDF